MNLPMDGCTPLGLRYYDLDSETSSPEIESPWKNEIKGGTQHDGSPFLVVIIGWRTRWLGILS
jgi:hypothetical protein